MLDEADPCLVGPGDFPRTGIVSAHKAGFRSSVLAGVFIQIHQQPGQFISAPQKAPGIFGQRIGNGLNGGVIQD